MLNHEASLSCHRVLCVLLGRWTGGAQCYGPLVGRNVCKLKEPYGGGNRNISCYN